MITFIIITYANVSQEYQGIYTEYRSLQCIGRTFFGQNIFKIGGAAYRLCKSRVGVAIKPQCYGHFRWQVQAPGWKLATLNSHTKHIKTNLSLQNILFF